MELNLVNNGKIIGKNSEILFLYDARMCNPNGDPDDENKPRMDYSRSINLVSDVRLKRYIRDFLADYKNKVIFISKVKDKTVSATGRLKSLILANKQEIEGNNDLSDLIKSNGEPDDKNLPKHLPWLLSKLIDVRFFGATMPLKAEEGKGASITFTGPVQFNWGYSLNKVTGPLDSSTITSTFAGAKEEYGSMGKEYRLAYSLIAFHGIISATRAKYTHLTENDVDLLDDAVINAIPLEATSRSKIGQYPLLYIRVEYSSPEFFIGDFRQYVTITDPSANEIPFDKTIKLRSPKDYQLDLSKLSKKLNDNKNNLLKVYFWKNSELSINNWDISYEEF